MSADAKAWTNEGSDLWLAVHDGECRPDALRHDQGSTLSETLASVETCLGTQLRWEMRQYPSGLLGLRGFVV